jgi:hypothetical protein
VNYWNQRAEIPAKQIVAWLGVGGSKYFDWKKRYGKLPASRSMPSFIGWTMLGSLSIHPRSSAFEATPID